MKKIEIGGLYEPPETGPLAEMTPDQIEKLLSVRYWTTKMREARTPFRFRCGAGASSERD